MERAELPHARVLRDDAPAAKRGIGLVLHLGAKVRDPAGMAIDDPEHLLGWLGPDRAMPTFTDRAELEARAPAVQALLRQWIAYV